ncbi:MAG TPA: hypothetical protein VHX65_10545 [Pirellulales bacterium]|nr:hypothetical protein [Pirellulales bacterium]
MRLFETIENLGGTADFGRAAEIVRQRRYGVIDAVEGHLIAVRFRPWPKWMSLPEAMFLGNRHHDRRRADRCRVYFNQPRRCSNFLTVPYVLCGRGTRLATLNAALAALDEIARIKHTDALLADVLNFRISPRALGRYGWAAHKPSRWHRHYIKRFYGDYARRAAPRAALTV